MASDHLLAAQKGLASPLVSITDDRPTSFISTRRAAICRIERYLASGAIRSIGPKLAEKIVGLYKEQTLEIFDESPDFVLHIRGIGQGLGAS